MCRATAIPPQGAVVCPNLAHDIVSPVVERAVQSATKPEKHGPQLVSILRASSFVDYGPIKRCKSYFNVPGLVGSRKSSTDSLQSESSFESSTWDLMPSKPKVSFCPRVLMKEFRRPPDETKEVIWYRADELSEFSKEVVALVRDYERKHWCGFFGHNSKLRHSHPALRHSDEPDNDDAEIGNSLDVSDPTVQNQIKRILLLDSHDLSLKLFAVAFQYAFPHAHVTMAKRSQEAYDLCQIQGNYYDIVVVEERLGLFWSQSDTGSSFLRSFLETQKCKQALCIGVSAHIDVDRATLMESGADICWSKPPPALTEATVYGLFQVLVAKRYPRA